MSVGVRKWTDSVVALFSGPESPHKVALGVAIGVAVAFTPTLGGQMALAGALAGLCGGSVRAALPTVWITNPLTAGPIYLGVYHIGRWIAPGMMDDLPDDAAGLVGTVALGLIIGGLVVGAVLGAMSYVLVRSAMSWRRWRGIS